MSGIGRCTLIGLALSYGGLLAYSAAVDVYHETLFPGVNKMARATYLLTFLVLLSLVSDSACGAEARRDGPEITDPNLAKADPDFALQGEYVGQGVLPDGTQGRVGAQVIARGNGQFEIYLLTGGLPGEGWKRGGQRTRLDGQRQGKVVSVEGDSISGQIAEGKMTLAAGDAKTKLELKRVERQSPTLGAKPPEGAVVLFDGTGLDYFPGATMSEEKNLVAGTSSKDEFNSYKLHLEFRLSWMPWAGGQRRSNSGVYIHNCYELQVLDSFGLEGRHNECGGLYSIKEPDLNMCLPPMVWQTYDLDFTAPEFDQQGNKVANARMTLRHNGVVIHDDLELPGATPGGQDEGPGPRGIHLQGHGCHVQYRNIWLVEKD